MKDCIKSIINVNIYNQKNSELWKFKKFKVK